MFRPKKAKRKFVGDNHLLHAASAQALAGKPSTQIRQLLNATGLPVQSSLEPQMRLPVGDCLSLIREARLRETKP